MSKYIPSNQKHLSLEDRKYIERSLNNGCSFKDIARFLCKNPTTISKEVKLHRVSDWYHKGSLRYNSLVYCVPLSLWRIAPRSTGYALYALSKVCSQRVAFIFVIHFSRGSQL